MEINNFTDIVNRLIGIIGIDAVLDNNVQNPRNLLMIDSLHLKDFMDIRRTEIGFEFSFLLDNKTVYLIRKEDEQEDDAPVYLSEDIYLKSSSTFLLIELAKWIAAHSKFIHKHKNFSGYYAVRELFPTLIKTEEYYIHYYIRLSDKYDAFTLRRGDSLLIFISRTQAILDEILKELNIIDDKEKSVPYKSDIIINGTLFGNKIKGNIRLLDKLVGIEIIEDKKANALINKWIEILTVEKMSDIKSSVSKKIIKATFSQTDNVTTKMINEGIKSLYEDLVIDLIDFEGKPWVRVDFKSEKLYPDYSISCMLNSKGKIVDCFIE